MANNVDDWLYECCGNEKFLGHSLECVNSPALVSFAVPKIFSKTAVRYYCEECREVVGSVERHIVGRHALNLVNEGGR